MAAVTVLWQPGIAAASLCRSTACRCIRSYSPVQEFRGALAKGWQQLQLTSLQSRRAHAECAVDHCSTAAPHSGPAQPLAPPTASADVERDSGVRQKRLSHTPKTRTPPPVFLRPDQPVDPLSWENAAVLVDKPIGWTSFDVCNKLRWGLKPLKVKKVGHAGTLDPMATGLLIICTGKATKHIDSFVAMQKEYSGTLRLGEGTESFDSELEVKERLPFEHISDADLEAAKQQFLGDIEQMPPMYSAVRVSGERLYKAARDGRTVERPARPVTVSSFDTWRDAGPSADPQDVHFRVVCSKGTYIRSLAHDLGRAAGSVAHLTALRREAIGEHCVSNAWQLPDLVALLQQQRDNLELETSHKLDSVETEQIVATAKQVVV